jgi:putative Holliday junction resolvase
MVCLEIMQRMGIDFGSKKIGIALTDESGIMSFPHSVIPNNSQLLKTIESLAHDRAVKEIVIGHSLDLAGNPNAIHLEVEEFITDITLSLGIPVHLEPEQYTTQEAARTTGKNAQTDAAAAAIILESYLTKLKN